MEGIECPLVSVFNKVKELFFNTMQFKVKPVEQVQLVHYAAARRFILSQCAGSNSLEITILHVSSVHSWKSVCV